MPEAKKTTKKAAPKKVAKKEFEVYNINGQLVRTYSTEVHGKDAGKLAEEFATKKHLTVK